MQPRSAPKCWLQSATYPRPSTRQRVMQQCSECQAQRCMRCFQMLMGARCASNVACMKVYVIQRGMMHACRRQQRCKFHVCQLPVDLIVIALVQQSCTKPPCAATTDASATEQLHRPAWKG